MIRHELFHRDDIDLNGTFRLRNAVRAVILNGEKIVLAYLENTGEYKFPGGGVQEGENPLDALRREVKEEIGAEVLSVGELVGIVQEYDAREEDPEDYFTMVSSYYLVKIKDELGQQNLDAYEREFGFRPVLVGIDEAIRTNRENIESKNDRKTKWIKRETFMLEKIRELYCATSVARA